MKHNINEMSIEYSGLCQQHVDVLNAMKKVFLDKSQEHIIRGCECSKQFAVEQDSVFISEIKGLSMENTDLYKQTVQWVGATQTEFEKSVETLFRELTNPFNEIRKENIKAAKKEYNDVVKKAGEKRNQAITRITKQFEYAARDEEHNKNYAVSVILDNVNTANAEIKKLYKRSKLLIQSYPHNPEECIKCAGLRNESDIDNIMKSLDTMIR